MSKEPKGYRMAVEAESASEKFFDMTARDSKAEVGQKFRMSANDGEETGRMKHAEQANTTKGI
jgi:hypothetical protein